MVIKALFTPIIASISTPVLENVETTQKTSSEKVSSSNIIFVEIWSIEKEYSFHLPEQDTPGPWKPELHVQVKEPGVLVHAALTSQLWPSAVAHSSLSGDM